MAPSVQVLSGRPPITVTLAPSELESHHRKYKLWKARPVLYSSAWHQLVHQGQWQYGTAAGVFKAVVDQAGFSVVVSVQESAES